MAWREYYDAELRRVLERVEQLPADSILRQTFNTVTRPRVESIAAGCDEQSYETAKWPCFYGLLVTCRDAAVVSLDHDILAVAEASEMKPAQVAAGLKHNVGDPMGKWYGDLFDLHTKATSLLEFSEVSFDPPVNDGTPKGKNNDIKCLVGRRRVRFESTVIVQDDEGRNVFDHWLNDSSEDKPRYLIRPGMYCPENPKGPSPYYDAARIYTKVFDKVAKYFDPSKTQLSENEPNILLLSFAGPGVSPRNPPVRWALDELFAEQPRSAGDANTPGGGVALMNWMNRRADELIQGERLTCDGYTALYNNQTLLRLLRRISGILLFDSGHFHSARINYNCSKRHRISHATMSRIECAFRRNAAAYL